MTAPSKLMKIFLENKDYYRQCSMFSRLNEYIVIALTKMKVIKLTYVFQLQVMVFSLYFCVK